MVLGTARGKELAKQQGKSYDEQCRDWYRGRTEVGIGSNPYQEELKKLKPEWF